MLGVVAECCWLKFENGPILHGIFVDVVLMMLYSFGQALATVVCQGKRTRSLCNSQHIATRPNGVASAQQCCVVMLRSFGRGLTIFCHFANFLCSLTEVRQGEVQNSIGI